MSAQFFELETWMKRVLLEQCERLVRFSLYIRGQGVVEPPKGRNRM
jgi:hypothetical protein